MLRTFLNTTGGTGFESFVYNNPGQASIALQDLVNSESLAVAKKYGLGTHGNDKKRDNLAVVRETDMPAVLTEICFIDSKDALLLKKDAFLRDMAGSYARGIAKFIGLPVKQKVNKVPNVYHTVVKGDTVSEIATEYKTTIDQIKKLNKLDDKCTIRIGHKLRVK